MHDLLDVTLRAALSAARGCCEGGAQPAEVFEALGSIPTSIWAALYLRARSKYGTFDSLRALPVEAQDAIVKHVTVAAGELIGVKFT